MVNTQLRVKIPANDLNTTYLLQQAIRMAKNGYKTRARELFIQIVEHEQDSLMAWLWLVDLQDDIEDRITACQNAVALSPGDTKIQTKLNDLLHQRETIRLNAGNPLNQKVKQAEHLLSTGKRIQAREILLQILETGKGIERVWMLLSEAVDEKEEQITALQNVLTINPENHQARIRLDQLEYFQENLLDLAAKLEEEGKYDEAITAYHKAAMEIRFGAQFDQIYRNIARLEKHKVSGVVYIRPDHSILRLTFGPPLLFLLLMLIHNQLNPFAFTPILWLGVLLTLGGGFLLAVSGVRSRHPIWEKLFDDPASGGSSLARLTVSLAGWLLIFVSFAYLMQISFERFPLVDTNTFLLQP